MPKNINTIGFFIRKPVFPASRLNLASTSSRYLEENVRHSSATYALAIETSGHDLFYT
jgi:hypothetical protein